MPVSIRDVARQAGVSHGTVSKVLNQQVGSYISDSTRERVVAVAKEMGYRPHRIARALATGRTNLVALWMTHIDRSYFGQVIHAAQEQAQRRGFGIIVGKMNYEDADMRSTTTMLDWPVDGVLALDGHRWLDGTIAKMIAPVPIVSIGSYYATSTDYVGVDVASGVKAAVKHVHEQGARRIAWLGTTLSDDHRTVAYHEAMGTLGLEPIVITTRDQKRSGGYIGIKESTVLSPMPDAIIGYNDDLIVGAYRALREMGMRSPRDILLVGIDGTEEGEYLDPSLSTVKQPIDEMCRLGWELLDARIKDPARPQERIMLDSELVIRESSLRA